MSGRWIGKWLVICLMLCVAAAGACAETRELAFGYEIELPEGVVITQEEWTPENRALMYLLSGTYQDGREKFRLRINYGFEHQLEKGEEYAESTNLSIEKIWLWMETTTEIKQSAAFGRSIGGEKREQLIDQIYALGGAAISSMMNDPTSNSENASVSVENRQLAFGYTTEMPVNVTITREEWTPEDDGIVYKIAGNYGTEEKRFTCIIFRQDDAFENANKAEAAITHEKYEVAGWIKGGFGLMAGFSWGMDEKQKTEADQLTEQFLDDFIALQKTQNVASSSQKKEKSIPPISTQKEEKILPQKSSVFLSGYIPGKMENSAIVTVEDGQYTIKIGKENDTAVLHHQFMEVEEGSVHGLHYVAISDSGAVVNQYTAYQYMPLPNDFPQDIEYMSDEEYLEMMERALNALAEEKAILLRDLLVEDFGLENPEIITNEAMKINHTVLREQIEGLSAGGWHTASFGANNAKKEEAIQLCRFWEIFNESVGYHRDYLINGIRWMEVDGALIGGYMGGFGHCAIFDGALHFVRGNFDLTSLMRAEDSIEPEKRENQEKNSVHENDMHHKETSIENGYRVVNTKSSPLTLRKTPGDGGAMILSIPKGERVQVLEDGEWPLVEYNGKQGYVNGKYLK